MDGSVVDKRGTFDDDDETCTSKIVKAGATVTFIGARNDYARLTGGEPTDDGYCSFAFIIADALTDGSGGTLQVDTSGDQMVQWSITEDQVEADPDFLLPLNWSSAELAYLKANKVGKDSDDAVSEVESGHDSCDDYAGYSGDELVGYLIDGSADETAIKYLCPKVAPALRQAKRGFSDGEYSVGDDVNAGTYRTLKKVRDCYWERVTGGGDTIANDFVSYAPSGVTVTIRSGDGGFKSERCGPWLRQ